MQLTPQGTAAIHDYVIGLAWAADGRWVAAASDSGPITILAAPDGRSLRHLPGDNEGTNSIAPHPSKPLLASGGQEGVVTLWDAIAGQQITALDLKAGWADHLAWSPDGSLLAAAAGRTLVLPDPQGGLIQKFEPAPQTISAVAWRPTGDHIAYAHFGGVIVRDAHRPAPPLEFSCQHDIHALVWSPDNRWLVSGNQDPSVHLWLPDTKDEFHMSGYEAKVRHLSFNSSGHALATSGGRDACVWDCRGQGPEGRDPIMLPHDSPICAVAYQNHHDLLASASTDGVVKLWEPGRKKPLRGGTVKLANATTRLGWSPDDRQLVISDEKGIVHAFAVDPT